ncbi:MAG: ThuA domain-containing protein [Bacteroidales bacterium]|nr:ThuA domain-containing protein [Bacteroidales bacterium]
MKKLFFISLILFSGILSLLAGTRIEKDFQSVKGKQVLIFTKNGEGYVHDNIAASVKALKEICKEMGMSADVTDNPAKFTDENLKRYDALIFTNTNNKVFDTDEQKKALQTYIRSGGGFVAIHSANATERDWPWMWSMVGGKFVRHAPHQQFDVLVTDSNHPSTSFLPERWTVNDECYYSNQLNPDIHVLLSVDLTTIKDEGMKEYPGETFGHLFPLCWCHKFDGGREWYTALGHDIEFYDDPDFRKHLAGGILWVLGVEDIDLK